MLPSPKNNHGADPAYRVKVLDDFIHGGSGLADVAPPGVLDGVPLATIEASAHRAIDIVSKVSFAHNDLLSGNILKLAGEHEVKIIDYEYGTVGCSAATLVG